MIRRIATFLFLFVVLAAPQSTHADSCTNFPMKTFSLQASMNLAGANSGIGIISTAITIAGIAPAIAQAAQIWNGSGANLQIVAGSGAPSITVTVAVQDSNNCGAYAAGVQGTAITLCLFDLAGEPIPWTDASSGASYGYDAAGSLVYLMGLALGLPAQDPSFCVGHPMSVMCPEAAWGSADGRQLKASDIQAIKNLYPPNSCQQSGKSASKDKDGDGIADAQDNCSTIPNANQADMDKDGKGDVCDPDIDGDTLLNAEEKQFGIDPMNPDTDGDGLNDGAEIKQYKTNPKVKDTDGDGVKDGEEIKMLLDPLNPDTDNDGLKDGEELANKTDPLFPDSDNDDVKDGDEVKKYGTDPKNPDTDGDGLKDGEEFKYQTNPGKMGDPVANMKAKDTDGDGLKDGNEVKMYGTDPKNPDTDGDGLKDGDEIKYKTLPGKQGDPIVNKKAWDTDGDGLSDGEEVNTHGTDPNKPDTDDDDLDDYAEVKVYKTKPGKMGDPVANKQTQDTDGDGLKDGEEVKKYKTDPLKQHSDADGWTDWDEVNKHKTSPIYPDTDKDKVNDDLDNCPLVSNPQQKKDDACVALSKKPCSTCNQVSLCQAYEAKKAAAFMSNCKLSETITVVPIGKNKDFFWSCNKGEGCFCALPIYLDQCADQQEACQKSCVADSGTTPSSGGDSSYIVEQCQALVATAEMIQTTMDSPQETADTSESAEEANATAAKFKKGILKACIIDGQLILQKLANPYIAQLEYELNLGSPFFTPLAKDAALNFAMTTIQKIRPCTSPGGEVAVAKYVDETIFGAGYICYYPGYFSSDKSYSLATVGGICAHEGLHALTAGLFKAQGNAEAMKKYEQKMKLALFMFGEFGTPDHMIIAKLGLAFPNFGESPLPYADSLKVLGVPDSDLVKYYGKKVLNGLAAVCQDHMTNAGGGS